MTRYHEIYVLVLNTTNNIIKESLYEDVSDPNISVEDTFLHYYFT